MDEDAFYNSDPALMSNQAIGAEIRKLIPDDIRVTAEAVKGVKHPRAPSLHFTAPSKVELLAVLFALQRAKETRLLSAKRGAPSQADSRLHKKLVAEGYACPFCTSSTQYKGSAGDRWLYRHVEEYHPERYEKWKKERFEGHQLKRGCSGED